MQQAQGKDWPRAKRVAQGATHLLENPVERLSILVNLNTTLLSIDGYGVLSIGEVMF